MKGVNRPLVMLSLLELGDEARQRQLWLECGGDEISSFVEAVLGVFDDSALEYMLNSGESEFGGAVDAQFAELWKLCDAIGYDISQEEVLAHPQMRSVRRVAQRILRMTDSSRDSTSP